jgi:hypothetical protein
MSDRESLSFVDVAPSLGMVEQHRLMLCTAPLGCPVVPAVLPMVLGAIGPRSRREPDRGR